MLQALLSSQPFPVSPGGQPHSPEMWWQDVPCAQLQRCMQCSPYVPGKHTGKKNKLWVLLYFTSRQNSLNSYFCIFRSKSVFEPKFEHILFSSSFVPLSQSFPLLPGGHWHSPVTWWQETPRAHRHRSLQPTPNSPASHAAHRKVPIRSWLTKTQNHHHVSRVSTVQLFTDRQRFLSSFTSDPPFSQRSPAQPALQLQRPVCLSHLPPFSHSHCCWQSAPKWPDAHSVETEQ